MRNDDDFEVVRRMNDWEGNRNTQNLNQFRFVSHKSHMTWSGLETGSLEWEASEEPSELRHGHYEI
jgi:hypothetical protein